MCGIVGYIGSEKKIGFLAETLQQLEYRGYDSCGLAAMRAQGVFLKKAKGKISTLKERLAKSGMFSLGIAHTRWATHGIPNHANAHPHSDCTKKIYLAHNGIIENYQELKTTLIKKGHIFVSDTDTEVIVHLIEELHKKDDFFAALLKAVNMLKGSFAISTFKKGEKKLYFARKDSPLILGVAKGGYILASDTPAIVGVTKNIITLQDGWAGVIDERGARIVTFKGKKVTPTVERSSITVSQTTKQNYQHFMLKEIYEQPKVLSNLFSLYVKNAHIDFKTIGITDTFLKSIRHIFIFACGTAYHAGFVAKCFLERHCGIDVEIDVSSEARYRPLSIEKNDLVIAISQSGETADTLAAVREAKKKKAKILGVCNVLGSTLTKESDGLIYTMAGPEIGVASTKAYTAQVFSMILFSLHLARAKKTIKEKEYKDFLKELQYIPLYQQSVLGTAQSIKRIASRFAKFGCFLFLGRAIHYPSALEGALKLKEISYIPAEGYPAGEMKHGPIALIDEYRAVVCIALKDELYAKMISNIQEIRARKGKVLGIVNERDEEACALSDETIAVPKLKHQDLSPLVVALPLQLFAYYVAKKLGCEIDQPRNLAKSVTVE